MTNPTIFAAGIGDATNRFVSRSEPQGTLPQKTIATIPAVTVAGTNIGMIRFERNFSLVGLAIKSDDLDTGTAVLLDVGFLLDDTTGEDDNAFLDNIDIAQDGGSLLWPVADGLLTGISFVATGGGWLSVTTRAASTTTAGDITVIAEFTYDLLGK